MISQSHFSSPLTGEARWGVEGELTKSGEGPKVRICQLRPKFQEVLNVKVAILTVSDKGARGEREDESGKFLKQAMKEEGAQIVAYEIVPDEQNLIEKKLKEFTDEKQADIVLTTGGTGFSLRDVTPEATLAAIDREAPGIAEAIRQKSLEITANAMLSRAVSGLRGRALIVNLPGSLKSVKESLKVIKPVLDHALEMIAGKEHPSGKEHHHH